MINTVLSLSAGVLDIFDSFDTQASPQSNDRQLNVMSITLPGKENTRAGYSNFNVLLNYD